MAAIMTWFCKATPAGVFAVCPFLLFWLAMCPDRAHAHGRPLPPLLRRRPFLRRETAKGERTHTERFFRRGVFALPEVSRIMRGAYAGGTRAHRTEMPRPCAAATARTAADSLLTQKAAQRPQERPQRHLEPPDGSHHARRRRPYSTHRSPSRRAIAPPSRRRLTSVY